MSVTLQRIDATDVQFVPGLCRLLQDVVHGGSSVGFLSPLSEAEAAAYWHHVFAELGDGRRL
jgi:hypothetical protein